MQPERSVPPPSSRRKPAAPAVNVNTARDERADLWSGTGIVEGQQGDGQPVERSKPRVGHSKFQSSNKFQYVPNFIYDKREFGQESGGSGAGAARRIEGRTGKDKEHDTGTTQGGGTTGGIGALVEKIREGINSP